MKSRSPKKKDDDAKYRKAKSEHFEEYPDCQFPGCNRSLTKGHVIDLHHKAGRRGPLLYCRKYFASLCRPHHDYVDTHRGWARKNGWFIDISSDEVWRMKMEEILND